MLKSTYYVVIGEKTLDLPLIYTNITQAAAWLDKRTEAEKEVKIFERFPVIGLDGTVDHKIYDVTNRCLDVLWNYYERN
jgi:hypothetical protein